MQSTVIRYFTALIKVIKNEPTPASFSFIFCRFNQTILQQINVKNVHPVSGARIQTHNPLITSLLS